MELRKFSNIPRLHQTYRSKYKAILIFIVYLTGIHDAECDKIVGESSQRRFLWKQMDDTVDDLMLGVMSGARAVKGAIGVGSSTSYIRHRVNPYDYLPSEATRIRYIIRSPMKMLKFRPPKKNVIKVMHAPPKPYIEGKFFKPKIKFPSSEDLRKLEKEQELVAEGKMPVKTGDEILAEIESEKKTTNRTQTDGMKTAEEIAMQKESEGQVKEYEIKINRPKKSGTVEFGGNTDFIIRHIPDFDEDWFPIPYQPDGKYPTSNYPDKLPGPFSTSRSYPVSKLHTNIIDSMRPTLSVKNYIPVLPTPVGKLHTSIIHSTRPHPIGNIYTGLEDYKPPSTNYDDARRKNHTYEVTEQTEETMVEPRLNSEVEENQESRNPTGTTTEEPNYPEEFLRKYRQRDHITLTAVKTTTTTTTAPIQKATSYRSLTPTSSIEENKKKNNNLVKGKIKNNSRVKTIKWPPELPAPKPFGIEDSVSSSYEADRLIQNSIETTPEPPIRKANKKKQRRTREDQGNNESTTTSQRETSQRGSIRFGDKINLDEM